MLADFNNNDFNIDFFRLLTFLQVAVPLKGHLDSHPKSEVVTRGGHFILKGKEGICNYI